MLKSLISKPTNILNFKNWPQGICYLLECFSLHGHFVLLIIDPEKKGLNIFQFIMILGVDFFVYTVKPLINVTPINVNLS